MNEPTIRAGDPIEQFDKLLKRWAERYELMEKNRDMWKKIARRLQQASAALRARRLKMTKKMLALEEELRLERQRKPPAHVKNLEAERDEYHAAMLSTASDLAAEQTAHNQTRARLRAERVELDNTREVLSKRTRERDAAQRKIAELEEELEQERQPHFPDPADFELLRLTRERDAARRKLTRFRAAHADARALLKVRTTERDRARAEMGGMRAELRWSARERNAANDALAARAREDGAIRSALRAIMGLIQDGRTAMGKIQTEKLVENVMELVAERNRLRSQLADAGVEIERVTKSSGVKIDELQCRVDALADAVERRNEVLNIACMVVDLAPGDPETAPAWDELRIALNNWRHHQRALPLPQLPARWRLAVRVLDERDRQDRKWGEQHHDLATWIAILGEEFGELSAAVLCHRFGNDDHPELDWRKEAIQVAAVAVSMVEQVDRDIAAGGAL